MAEPWIRAQVTFSGTLMGDGSLLIHESFVYRETADADSVVSHDWHPTEGTCDPQELAYTLWAEMEGHI